VCGEPVACCRFYFSRRSNPSAKSATVTVRDHALRDLNLSRVISLIHPKNAASRRVAEKIRMQFEHKTVFKGFPALVFMISREQWLTNRAA
jgi:RimJ/RimL family protein N-acetyltransferase